MNILTGIISGVKTLLGASPDGSSNVMKVAAGLGGWIDKQQFTTQEKADFNAKMVESYAEFMKSTVGENTQRSLTRRSLAIWILRTEVILLISSAAIYKIDPAWSQYIYKIATDSPMNILVMGVGSFFFGIHVLRSMQK